MVVPLPNRLLTMAEWDALNEDPLRRYELAEGVLVVVPRPMVCHQQVMAALLGQLSPQLPLGWTLLPEVEIVVQPTDPATVRVPDLVVVPAAALRGNPARLNAGDVLLAVEVLSAGTERTDTVTKFAEYAEAGIGAYWIVDPEPPVSLAAYVLVDGEYEIATKGTGPLTLLAPAELHVELDRLLP